VSESSTSSQSGLREFWAGLPVEGRWLLSTVAVQTLGRGLTLPFTVIYLHEVRGISLDLAGLLMAFIALVALLVTGPGGALTDRLGARRMLLWGTGAQMVGCVILAFATTPVVVALAFVFLGFNFGVSWPAFNALVAAITTGATRQQYFGINFALVNLGIGLGGVIGGLYADVADPSTFTVIFLADAASMLVPIGLLLGPLRHVHGRAEKPEGESAAAGSYLTILRNPAVVWVTLLTFLGVFIGYGQMEAGFPAFARQVSQVSTSVIGFAFAVNTAVIVGLQFYVLRRITGRRRTRVLMGMSALWALAWLVLGLTGFAPGGVAAAVGVLAFHATFALGETLLQPTIPAITNDMAPDHLRGRYNAVNAGAFQSGTILGPVVAGFMLNHHWSAAFIAMIVVGCALMVVLAFAVERRITPLVNGLQDDATPTGPSGPQDDAAPTGPGAGSAAGPEAPALPTSPATPPMQAVPTTGPAAAGPGARAVS
jgi:MFS family permease